MTVNNELGGMGAYFKTLPWQFLGTQNGLKSNFHTKHDFVKFYKFGNFVPVLNYKKQTVLKGGRIVDCIHIFISKPSQPFYDGKFQFSLMTDIYIQF
jgi:hypothetical protein